jgi:hypothetical protein
VKEASFSKFLSNSLNEEGEYYYAGNERQRARNQDYYNVVRVDQKGE